MSNLNDLVKLKCDFFDKAVSFVKKHMEIDKEYPRIIVKYDICYPSIVSPCFLQIVKNHLLYEFDDYECGVYYAEHPQETELEDGIYHKGFKVSDL